MMNAAVTDATSAAATHNIIFLYSGSIPTMNRLDDHSAGRRAVATTGLMG
jgi:hypothetical protein